MRTGPSLRLCALLLCVCLLWAACGCPLTPPEWAQLPQTLQRILARAPAQALLLWRSWLLHPPALLSRDFAGALRAMGSVTLRVWNGERQSPEEMALESYVLGVTAAEMPAGYAPAALQCQAVAARTRAISTCLALGGNGCRSHPDCDVCTSSACCQGYLSAQGRREKWGDTADVYEARLAAAVRQTAGQILVWDGLPIETLYHACSGGVTEDAAAVFSRSVPYLVSVDSPGEEQATGFEVRTEMTRVEAAQALCAAFPGCGVTAEQLPAQLKLLSSTASGRISRVRVGSAEVTGAAFRQALGLRSTLCTWEADGDSITFSTRGYGHGVGMSQVGAQAMAASGAGCPAILAHYYPGTCLVTLPEE